MEFIQNHWSEMLDAAAYLIAGASVIASLTPTDADNKALAAVIRVLDMFGFNVANRNPRK